MSTASLKITHLTSVHKLIVPLTIKWADLEEQIRNIFSIPSDTPFLLRYRDEDGDLITLNSDLEFEQVLCTGARVKFLLTLPQDEVDQPDADWDMSSTSSFDTISEEPVFVQQEAERDEEVVAAYFVDMDTEDINPGLQSESNDKPKDKQKEKEVENVISSDGGVEVEIFHDFPGSLHPSQKKQELPEEHDQEMRHVKILETASTTSGELPIVQERQADQDKHKSSTIEGLSTKFEKVIQQCCKVLGDDPEMLDKVDSAMNHILENTPMYVEFVLNMLNSAKNQNQNTGSSSSNEDNSQQDRIYNPPDMPGSFPNNAPLFQFRSYPSSSRHSVYSTLPPPPPPLNMLPPPPPPPPAPIVLSSPPPPPPPRRVTVNQLCNTPPYQPLNPSFTSSQRHAWLPPFPGSFPSTSNDLDSENYSSELSELQDMGFANREQNLNLLRKYDGNMEDVVDVIISQKENGSNSASASSSSRPRPKPYSHRSPVSHSGKIFARPHSRHSNRKSYTDDSLMFSD